MKFYKYLYVGDTIKNPSRIKWKLKHHAGVKAHVIAVAHGADQLEIYHSAYLQQRYFRYHPPIIVGIASDYNEAVQIIIQITQECLEYTGTCNLKEYLKLKAMKNQDNSEVLL